MKKLQDKIITLAIMMIGASAYAGERYTPVMRPSAPVCAPCGDTCKCSPSCQCPAPAVQLFPARPADGSDTGDLCSGSQATDTPATIALAVGQCPGGVCPVPQRAQVVNYAPPVVNYSEIPNSSIYTASPQPVYTVATERPRLFARLFSPDRPKLFGRLFGGKLFGGGCCGK